MSQSVRSELFLREMGIGVHWKLRDVADGDPAPEAADPFVAAVQAIADGHQHVAPPASAPAAAAPALAVMRESPAAAQPPAVSAPPPAVSVQPPAVSAQPPAISAPSPAVSVPPAAAPDEESTAWFDDAPAPARPAPVSDEAIATMNWAALKAAVSTCTRCPLCETRRNAVNGRGASEAKWIAIAAGPTRLDEKDGQAVAGDAGQLLTNMLKAIELQPEADVYITNLVKCRPAHPDGADRAPAPDELLACRPFLARELALTGATMAMTFGQHAARGLMLGAAARGKVMHYGDAKLPVVATYHPDDLLRKPEDKAKAWADLCLAKASHHG